MQGLNSIMGSRWGRLIGLLLAVLLVSSACQKRQRVEMVHASALHPETEKVEDNVLSDRDENGKLPDSYFIPYDPKDYRVSVGDSLEISIWGHPDTLVRAVPVAPDGRIYYMFTEGIPAEGKTVEELAEVISQRVRHLFSNPEVTIIPKYISSARYVILGKVKKPGEFPLFSSVTLRQALAEAGGLDDAIQEGTSVPAASLSQSFIVRNGKRLDIDFSKLLDSAENSQNIYIRPGDYIYIASALSKQVYRMGAVRETRAVPYKDGLTVVGLLSGATDPRGGLLPDASPGRVVVLRGTGDKPQVITVDVAAILAGKSIDMYLVPGDVVYVPPKRFLFMRTLVRMALETFARSFGSTAGLYYTEEKWLD